MDKYQPVLTTSLPYLAPEMLSKVPYDPIIADVFAFGVCLFIALNDSLPFGLAYHRGNRNESTCLLKPQVEHLLSQDVKKCLKAMLQFDVNKRATSFSLDHEAWFQK